VDARLDLVERSERLTYCLYKGECFYFSILVGGVESADAIWTYQNPYESVCVIRNYMAFCPDRVDSITESQNDSAAS